MKWRIDDVPVFVAVVERGGITAAAQALAMPKSSVSKSITRLEHDLGVRLLDRNSRRVRVTSEGEAFFRQCQRIMDEIGETDAVMTGLTMVPRGRLTVATPPAFCQEVLAPHLADFHRRYPEIELDLVVTSHAVDMLGDQFDVAVVVGVQADSEFTQKSLLGGRLIWIAAPAYVAANDIGRDATDLLRHVQICERRYVARPLALKQDHQTLRLDVGPRAIRVNDPLAVREAVVHGAGVSFLPERYCRDLVRAGRLTKVGTEVEFDTSASILSAVFPSRRLVSARTRAFLDFLEEICAPLADADRRRA